MESDVIESTQWPATVDSLERDLHGLGLPRSAAVIVHSSLSAIGWTVGGAEAVIEALSKQLGSHGTLVMPTHSAQLTDPATWINPPVPTEWWPSIRESMPPYNPASTPTSGMGAIPETFRRLTGVSRSSHPTASFAARGPLRDSILAGQTLDDGLGNRSPLAQLYDADGWVLLLGVGHSNNTSLHLAQYRAAGSETARVSVASPITVNQRRLWCHYSELGKSTDDFDAIGAAFDERTGHVRRGHVGTTTAQLLPIVPLVDFATDWFGRNQPAPLSISAR